MRIRELRQARGLTQRQLAELVGMSIPTVCQWEIGLRTPQTRMLPRIARALGCTIDQLYDPAEAGESGTDQAPAS